MNTGPRLLLASILLLMLLLFLVLVGFLLVLWQKSEEVKRRFLPFTQMCLLMNGMTLVIYSVAVFPLVQWSELPLFPLLMITVVLLLLFVVLAILVVPYLDKWLNL